MSFNKYIKATHPLRHSLIPKEELKRFKLNVPYYWKSFPNTTVWPQYFDESEPNIVHGYWEQNGRRSQNGAWYIQDLSLEPIR